MEIKCPKCCSMDVEEGDDFLDMDVGKYILDLCCENCGKKYTAHFGCVNVVKKK